MNGTPKNDLLLPAFQNSHPSQLDVEYKRITPIANT